MDLEEGHRVPLHHEAAHDLLPALGEEKDHALRRHGGRAVERRWAWRVIVGDVRIDFRVRDDPVEQCCIAAGFNGQFPVRMRAVTQSVFRTWLVPLVRRFQPSM